MAKFNMFLPVSSLIFVSRNAYFPAPKVVEGGGDLRCPPTPFTAIKHIHAYTSKQVYGHAYTQISTNAHISHNPKQRVNNYTNTFTNAQTQNE